MSCQPRYSDLVFVGGGLSNTLTFIYLLRMLLTAVPSVPVPRRLRDITILDKNGDFGTGVSYGRAAHPALLLNEPVSVMNFCSFLPWLAANRRRWLMKLQASNHQAVRNWLTCNRKALQNAESNVDSYLPLYLPRCVFGSFLKDRFTEALSAAERSSLFSVDLLAANAVELVRAAGASLKNYLGKR